MVKKTKVKKTRKIRIRPAAPTKEVTRLGAALRALGSLGGSAVGGLIGMPSAGAGVGSSLGAALSKWLGSGDYTVANNSIVRQSMKASSSIPMMHESGQSVVIRHREFLGEVRGSTSYLVRDSYELNPGNNRTFPWLSGIARNFQEYRFKGVVFHYIPTSGNAIAASAAPLGSVMMQTSYRATDTPPSSKVEILNEYNSNECVPSETFAHPIECDPKENPFSVQYVRSTDVPPGDNAMLYDLGVTHVAVSGQLANDTVLGDLWVTYEVELKKPLITSNVTGPRRFAGSWVGLMTSANIFNGTFSSFGINATGTGTTITMPKGSVGSWVATLRIVSGTAFTQTSGLACTYTDAIALPWNTVVAGTQSLSTNVGTGSTLGSYISVNSFRITDPSAQATITFNQTFTGASGQTQLTLVRYDE